MNFSLLLMSIPILFSYIGLGSIIDDINRHLTRRIMSKNLRKVWKRQHDDSGYLEQCSILQFWDKQIGKVNVLAFFDSSWQFSHRQAKMLKQLKLRLDKTNFDNIQFFVINASPQISGGIDYEQVSLEEETWREVSPSEADGDPAVVVTSEALVETLGPDIYFIQDDRQLRIWEKLQAFRDQILVIDRCGRLSYQVIIPWSILHFPYVKAAILSTYKDEPCGYCQFKDDYLYSSTSQISNNKDSIIEETTTTTTVNDETTLFNAADANATETEYEKPEGSSEIDEFKEFLYADDLDVTFMDETTTFTSLNTESTTEEFATQSLETTLSSLEETNDTSTQQIPITDPINNVGSTERNARSQESGLNYIDADNDTDSLLSNPIALPIRIIMRAPHIDEYIDSTNKSHEYLILKTGEPDYHGHLGDEHDSDNEDLKVKIRTFGKDESPGIYGEMADFWRIFGNENMLNNSYEDDFNEEEVEKSNESTQESIVNVDDSTQSSEDINESPEFVSMEHNIYNTDVDKENTNNQDDIIDEEAKSKLIAHYSKLLPYLYYILD